MFLYLDRIRLAWILAAVVTCITTAPHRAHSSEPDDEPTAADVANSPRDGDDVSGIEGGQSGPPGYLWVPRLALFPARGLLEIGMAPLRGLIYIEQKHAVMDRLRAFFFTEDELFGIFPTALVETGFGLNVGGRLVWKEMFDTPAKLKLRAGYGGQFQKLFAADFVIEVGSRVVITASGLIESRPRDRFFGIGGGDEVSINDPRLGAMGPLDAVNSDLAVGTRFSEDLSRAGIRADAEVAGPLRAAVESAFIHRRFESAQNTSFQTGVDHPSSDAVYDSTTIPGFDDGVDYIYTELELSLDTRRATSRFASDPIPGTGWYLETYGGYAGSVADDATSFFRYGIDVQRYIRLAQNPRTLVLRTHLEGVEGVKGDLEDVPFTELPRLGGPTLLRGYRRDRFRDRHRGLVTAEYQWDLMETLAGFLFVDAGQVFREYADFDMADTRVAFGGGLQLHTKSSYIGRFLVGTSLDGGLIINVAFDPAFDILNRTTIK